MKRCLEKLIILICMCLHCPLPASAEVEWEEQQTLKLEKKPVDILVSARGSYMFVLTDDGTILVYDSEGNLNGQIDAGKDIDEIACGPDENLLILKSKKNKEIRTIIIEFIQDINIEKSPFKGRADAPVVIVVFTDYQCSHCAKLSSLLNQVIENNKDTVKIVIKNMPLSMHSFARNAAAAALAADSMGRFWEFHEALYNMKQFNKEKVRAIATGLGLDPDRIEKEMESKKIQSRIDQDLVDAKKAGVRSTPTVFINGKTLKDRSIEGFQEMIDAQLKKQK